MIKSAGEANALLCVAILHHLPYRSLFISCYAHIFHLSVERKHHEAAIIWLADDSQHSSDTLMVVSVVLVHVDQAQDHCCFFFFFDDTLFNLLETASLLLHCISVRLEITALLPHTSCV